MWITSDVAACSASDGSGIGNQPQGPRRLTSDVVFERIIRERINQGRHAGRLRFLREVAAALSTNSFSLVFFFLERPCVDLPSTTLSERNDSRFVFDLPQRYGGRAADSVILVCGQALDDAQESHDDHENYQSIATS